jgi:hypothetical protein
VGVVTEFLVVQGPGQQAGMGHSRLAFLSGPTRSNSNAQWLEGLDKFTADNPGIELQVLPAGSSFEAGYENVDAVLDSGAADPEHPRPGHTHHISAGSEIPRQHGPG